MQLLPFQKRFIRELNKPEIHTAALSIARGNGKTTLAAYICYQWLLSAPQNAISHMVAASLEQGRRGCFRQLIAFCESNPELWKITNNRTEAAIKHRGTGAVVSVLAANSRTAQGLVGVDWLIADEPGSWQVNAGIDLFDAVTTALGKPGNRMKVVFIGTLAPSAVAAGHFYFDLVHGDSPGVYSMHYAAANPETWDKAATIQKANPLMWRFPESRKQLLRERDAARLDERLKARFLSYRLNIPSRDQSEVLITVSDFQLACSRPAAIPAGMPIVGVDLGASRAFSSAVAIWPSGRIEAVAVMPGIPSVAEIEKRDSVIPGTYQRLVDAGQLFPDFDRRVPRVELLIEKISDKWGRPSVIVCDRFRIAELDDAVPRGWQIDSRVTRWSECAADIRDLRRGVLDNGFSFSECSRELIAASLAIAKVRSDDQGNVRLVKADKNKGRDDVCAAMVLAAGAWQREQSKPKPKFRVVECA